MKIGGHLLCEDFPLYMEAAKHMDQGGYDRLWSVDSQMLWQDAYVYGAYALEHTTQIQFGSAVIPNCVDRDSFRVSKGVIF